MGPCHARGGTARDRGPLRSPLLPLETQGLRAAMASVLRWPGGGLVASAQSREVTGGVSSRGLHAVKLLPPPVEPAAAVTLRGVFSQRRSIAFGPFPSPHFRPGGPPSESSLGGRLLDPRRLLSAEAPRRPLCSRAAGRRQESPGTGCFVGAQSAPRPAPAALRDARSPSQLSPGGFGPLIAKSSWTGGGGGGGTLVLEPRLRRAPPSGSEAHVQPPRWARG